MHMGLRFARCVAGAGLLLGLSYGPVNAWPAHGRLGLDRTSFQRASDNCWWWGTRWQYGWRGYGWYACWDEAKPTAPTVMAPEAVPESAVVPESCVKTWRDKSGNLRSRRVC